MVELIFLPRQGPSGTLAKFSSEIDVARAAVELEGLARFALVVIAIDGGDDVGVGKLEVAVAKLEGGLAGDGDDHRGTADVAAFAEGEAIDDVTHGRLTGCAGILRGDVPHEARGTVRLRDAEVLHGVGSVGVGFGERRSERGVAVPDAAEAVGHVTVVAQQFAGGPEDVSVDALRLALLDHLLRQLSGLHGAGHVLPDVERCACLEAAPPADERRVVGGLVADLPIELRGAVVDPAVLHPQHHVGIEVVVVLQPARVAAVAVGRLVAVDAEGADAKADPGLGRGYGHLQLADQEVDVVAPPVIAPVGGEARGRTVAGEALLVRERLAGDGVGIEIVVDMDAVDVVTGDDVAHHAADEESAVGDAGIEERHAVIAHEPLGMAAVDVRLGEVLKVRCAGAIGVEPGVKLQPAQVAGFDEVSQWIERVVLGRFALTARQPAAPRLVARGVEGVGLGADLEEDGVDAIAFQAVEALIHERAKIVGRESAVVVLVDGLKPRAAKFAFGIDAFFLLHEARCGACAEAQEQGEGKE